MKAREHPMPKVEFITTQWRSPMPAVVLAEARRRAKCKAVRTSGPEGDDYSCGYDTTITCDDCKYAAYPGRKDPEAKCNQPKE